jgi:hypothetical protein
MHYDPLQVEYILSSEVKPFYINAEQIIEDKNVVGVNIQSVMTRAVLVSCTSIFIIS